MILVSKLLKKIRLMLTSSRLNLGIVKSIILMGTDERALVSAGLKDTDYFFALSDDESTNVISSLIAHENHIEYTFCLLNRPHLSSICNALEGIFSSFNLRDDAGNALYQIIHRADFQNYFTIYNSSIEILEVKIENQDHLIVQQASDLKLPEGVFLLLVFGRGKMQFSYENPSIQKQDTLLLLLNRLDREKVIHYLAHQSL